ncbi:hypothetical protein BX600DRAFT_510191 [Xylariales sp. PMI_506]|nr:hypothetical protein BX600DRAFT_510191 [Xylariales sp. PMI_506]
MPSYTVNEPHPTVPKNSYTHSGRGGAGNFFRAPATTPAGGIPTSAVTSMPLPPSSSSAGRFYSGRGGAGNARAASQRPVMSFDEQYKISSQMESKPMGHVGRGGAGNTYDNTSRSPSDASRRTSDASVRSHASDASSKSAKSGFLARLSQTISRH